MCTSAIYRHVRDKQSLELRTPLSLKFGPTILTEATNQRDDMDKVADAILALHGVNMGNVEVGHSESVEKATFALR